jgi:hypothetical protein
MAVRNFWRRTLRWGVGHPARTVRPPLGYFTRGQKLCIVKLVRSLPRAGNSLEDLNRQQPGQPVWATGLTGRGSYFGHTGQPVWQPV